MTYAEWMSESVSDRYINVAIANSQVRQKIVQRCEKGGVIFFEVRASNVVELDDVQLGDGAVL
jgi:hypothetical protein